MWFAMRQSWAILARYQRQAAMVACAVIVIIVGLVVSYSIPTAMWRDAEYRSHHVMFDIVLQDNVNDSAAMAVATSVSFMKSVEQSALYYPDAVWRQLARSTGVTVQNLKDVVTLPMLVRCRLSASAATRAACQALDVELQEAHGSVIRDVVWSEALVDEIDRQKSDVRLAGYGLSVWWILCFLTTVLYAFRRIINVSAHDIAIGSDNGISPWRLGWPYALSTIWMALLGIGIVGGALAASWTPAVTHFPWLGWITPRELVMVIGIVATVCIATSWIQAAAAVRRQRTIPRADRATR